MAGPGRLGDRVSLGFIVETERQVEAHLQGHLDRLPAADHASRAIVGGPIPVTGYLATIEVKDEGPKACRIDWSSHFEPKGISEEQGRAMIEGVYKGGIAGVKKALGV